MTALNTIATQLIQQQCSFSFGGRAKQRNPRDPNKKKLAWFYCCGLDFITEVISDIRV